MCRGSTVTIGSWQKKMRREGTDALTIIYPQMVDQPIGDRHKNGCLRINMNSCHANFPYDQNEPETVEQNS